MIVAEQQQIDVVIDAVSSDGRGIGRFNNQVIFVPKAIPGQHVNVCITSVYPRYLEGEVFSILRQSPYERPAPCIHAEQCGGCSWQQLVYEQQLILKQNTVKNTLERIGKVSNPCLLDMLRAPKEWGYRNKMEFAFVPSESLDKPNYNKVDEKALGRCFGGYIKDALPNV